MNQSLIEKLEPLSRMIVNEVLVRLKEDGYLVRGTASLEGEAKAALGQQESELLGLWEAAKLLEHSYFWLSRNYRSLGLKPSKIGGKLLFERGDVRALLKRQKVGRVGRPRAATLRPYEP